MKTIVKNLFNLLLLAAMLLIGANSAKATVILDETFNYAEGNLSGNGRWATVNAGGAAPQIIATPLSYPSYIHSGQGKAAQTNYASGASNYRTEDTLTNISTSSGVVYLSFLYRGDGNQSQSQSEVIGLGALGTGNYIRVWAGKNSAGTTNGSVFRLGTTRASGTSGDIAWSANDICAANTTYLIVLKYDMNAKTSHIAVNPTVGSTIEPETWAASDSVSSATFGGNINTIVLRQNASSAIRNTIGGIRVSTTWAEAVASSAADVVAPTLADTNPFSPANGATSVAVDAALTATFSEPVKAGAGAVKLINETDGNAETDIAVSFDGATMTITPDAVLQNGKTYHVEIPANGVTDIAGNAFAGISNTDWVFATTAQLSDEKNLDAITIRGQRGATVILGTNLTINVAPTAKMDSLVITELAIPATATATIGSKKIEADSVINASSGSVTITVTAQNASTQDYTLAVSNAADTENELLTFRINSNAGVGIPSNVNGEIRNDSVLVTLPASATSITELVANFTKSTYANVYVAGTGAGGADSLQASGTTVNDFTGVVTYKVRSEAGVDHEYKVVVTVAAKPQGLIFEENFDFTNGIKLSEQATTGWRLDGSPDSTMKVSDAKLDFAGYAPSNTSKSVQAVYPVGASSAAYYKSLPVSVSTDSVYLACMINVTEAQTGQGLIGLSQGASGQRPRIWVKRDGGSSNSTGVYFGISRNASTAASADYEATGTLVPYGTTALVVLKHVFVAGADNDRVTLFINPTPGNAEPAPNVSVSNASTGADPTLMDGVFMRANGSNALKFSIAGIRVATSWEEAVKYGEPAGAPVVESLEPINGATDAVYSTNPVATFNKIVKAGTGNILIKKYSDDSEIGNFDVTNASKVVFSGKTMTINAAPLTKGEKMYVEIPSGAVQDNSSQPYGGTINKDTWAFTAPKSTACSMDTFTIASPTTPGLVYKATFVAATDSAYIITSEQLTQLDIDNAHVVISPFASATIKSNGYDFATGEGVIVYTVTAEDGTTTKDYRIAFFNMPAADFVLYNIGSYVGKIDKTNGIVTVSLPSSTTDVSALVATFEISPGASISVNGTPQVSDVTANDFSNDTVFYTITSSDEQTVNTWKVIAAPQPTGLLLTEGFHYPADMLLKNAAGSGWIETQNTITNSFVNSYIVTDTTKLQYKNYAGATDDTSRSVRWAYDGVSGMAATTVKSISRLVDITEGTVYFSFMLNANTVTSSSGTEIVGFTSTLASVAGQTRVYLRRVANNNTTQFTIGLGKNHSSITGVNQWSSTPLTTKETHLVVLKYDFGTGFASLYVNPVVGNAEPTEPLLKDNAISGTAVDITGIRGISIRANGTNQPAGLKIGGIRVATTWEDAVKMGDEVTETGSDFVTYSLNIAGDHISASTIDPTTGTIRILVPNGLDLTGLVATFSLSPSAVAYIGAKDEGGIEQESGITANNFDVPVTYIVYPLKGTQKEWTVIVGDGGEQNAVDKNYLKISVYPNPVVQDLYLQSDETLSRVEVYNVSGNLLYVQNNPDNVVNFSRLGQGTYFVRFFSVDGKKATVKIVK